MKLLPLALMLAALTLSACKQEVAQDIGPQEFTAESLGHYCQMNLLEHPGPKAQVVLEGMPTLFFSQVRDAIAYQRAPEQMAPILAIYVNDMGAPGASWDVPGEGNWIDADVAFFVVGSAREGGMGAPETVPFSTRAAAQGFADAEGGTVLELGAIRDDMVLAPVDMGDEDDDDYLRRLRALSQPAGG